MILFYFLQMLDIGGMYKDNEF